MVGGYEKLFYLWFVLITLFLVIISQNFNE